MPGMKPGGATQPFVVPTVLVVVVLPAPPVAAAAAPVRDGPTIDGIIGETLSTFDSEVPDPPGAKNGVPKPKVKHYVPRLTLISRVASQRTMPGF